MTVSVPIRVIAAAWVIIGLVMCFRGYRAFRAVLGLLGFTAGAWFGWSLAGAVASGVVVWIAAIVGGIVGAAIVTVVYPVGVFLLGAAAGWLVGSLVSAGGGAGLLVPIAAAALGGLLAFVFRKLIIVVSTAIAGAWHVIAGVLCLLGRPIDPFGVYTAPGTFADFSGGDTTILVVLWAALAAVGIAAQYRAGGPAAGHGKGDG